MKFSQRGGSTIFLLLPGGDKKFNRVFHPVSTTPPCELKNDNSLNFCKHPSLSSSLIEHKQNNG